MISAELVNNSDSEAAINIAGINPYSLDRENGEITRLSICESIFMIMQNQQVQIMGI